jgi:hypothetical protein
MALSDYLAASSAAGEFKDAVRAFLTSGEPNGRLVFAAGAPRVKIERTLTQLLKAYRAMPIESVQIDGRSGCEFFRGRLLIRTAAEERYVKFDWDCRWKALQLGWTDYFGLPDQIRAAREFGFDCFRQWQEAA